MPKFIAVTPTYATRDLARILEIEERQLEDTIADLTEEQMHWRPNPKAKSALDILWHLAYSDTKRPMPHTKAEALEGLRAAHAQLQRDIATPGKLDEPLVCVAYGRYDSVSRQDLGLDSSFHLPPQQVGLPAPSDGRRRAEVLS